MCLHTKENQRMLIGLYSHMTVLWIKHLVIYIVFLQEGKSLNFSLHMLQ